MHVDKMGAAVQVCVPALPVFTVCYYLFTVC